MTTGWSGAKKRAAQRAAGGRSTDPGPPPTRDVLHEAALAYLARGSATAATLGRVLDRKVSTWARKAARAARDPEVVAADIAGCREFIEGIIARFREVGLINDAAYAKSRARSLSRSGRSRRAIASHLAAKGVDQETAREALPNDAEIELAAALTFARKRRIGPYAREAPDDRDLARKAKQKALAAMGRAGFGGAPASAPSAWTAKARRLCSPRVASATEGLRCAQVRARPRTPRPPPPRPDRGRRAKRSRARSSSGRRGRASSSRCVRAPSAAARPRAARSGPSARDRGNERVEHRAIADAAPPYSWIARDALARAPRPSRADRRRWAPIAATKIERRIPLEPPITAERRSASAAHSARASRERQASRVGEDRARGGRERRARVAVADLRVERVELGLLRDERRAHAFEHARRAGSRTAA